MPVASPRAVAAVLLCILLGSADADVPQGRYRASRAKAGVIVDGNSVEYHSCGAEAKALFDRIERIDGRLRAGGMLANGLFWRVEWKTPSVITVLHPETTARRKIEMVLNPPNGSDVELQVLFTQFDDRGGVECADAMSYRGHFSTR